MTVTEWWLGPTNIEAEPSQTEVIGLRYGAHSGFDRVVIDIRDMAPGIKASYVDELVYDGSGEPIPLQPAPYRLSVVLAQAVAHNELGGSLYFGPKLEQAGLKTLKGIALAGDFEGYVSFGFTVMTKRYHIYKMTDPRRVVIEWKHVIPPLPAV